MLMVRVKPVHIIRFSNICLRLQADVQIGAGYRVARKVVTGQVLNCIFEYQFTSLRASRQNPSYELISVDEIRNCLAEE